ncbi:unnamed protein product [Lepeophtheirus salmonis]|uniref:(salmon louse) hypothetical protein n=1 Tax=Lepeophtheirus salmonis TaxID=72036 RepID=A0A7R8CE12_LEPSM|nr:unnamed protein product [Lepeophtheirus salmonis]CAF2780872.1 unnamed protein product [Lepeophtheirus salmonis]
MEWESPLCFDDSQQILSLARRTESPLSDWTVFTKIYANGRIKLALWDTGGMERIASITSSYYKFSQAAILVFALDRPHTFHVLSQHLLDIVTYAENAKIFLCGNKFDLKSKIEVSDQDMEITGEGVEEMFEDIALKIVESNRSRMELHALEQNIRINSSGPSFEESNDKSCPNC